MAMQSRFVDKPNQPRTLFFSQVPVKHIHVVEIAFKATWFDKWNWLHYDEAADAAFFHVCMTTSQHGKLKAASKTYHLYREAFLTGRMPQKDFDDTNMNINQPDHLIERSYASVASFLCQSFHSLILCFRSFSFFMVCLLSV